MSWVDAARLCFGTLTVLPAGVPYRVDRHIGGRAMLLAPVAGAVLGGVAAGVVALAQLLQPEADLLAAVLAVLVVVALSGALHLDGLADFADALGSRRDRETMLRIMKQSDIGPFGVVAVVAVLLMDVAALTSCIQSGFGWQAVLVATIAGRLTLPWSCRTAIPSARPGGLGSLVAATVTPTKAVVVTVIVLAAVAIPPWLLPGTPASGAPIRAGVAVATAVLLAVVTSVVASRRAHRLLGGTTGDVLGATVEIAAAVALLTLAFV